MKMQLIYRLWQLLSDWSTEPPPPICVLPICVTSVQWQRLPSIISSPVKQALKFLNDCWELSVLTAASSVYMLCSHVSYSTYILNPIWIIVICNSIPLVVDLAVCFICRVNCSFFFKIGACRHGERCSRLHNKPTFSQTILLQNLYLNPQNSAQVADPTFGQFVHKSFL